MKKFFEPDSVVMIGASRNTGPGAYNGVELMLRYGFKGRIYPINPHAEEICGIRSYRTVADVPEQADLALISIGRDLVTEAVSDCICAGIRRVIIISQGFSDADERGADLQREIAELAGRSGTRILGPNTMGVLNNFRHFSTGFIDTRPPRRVPPVSVIAQTGLIQVASENFSYGGWGKAVDIGNGCDVDFTDALDYFGEDPETRIIALHMEGILRGREFLEKVSRITRTKPVIALKTGRSRAGAKAALSHTGSLVGEDAVTDAAFDRAGIIRVKNNFEMAVAIRALLRFGELAGNRLGVITATGAAGIMAMDACEEFGLEAGQLPTVLPEKLKAGKPDWIHTGNPLDIWPIGMIGRNYKTIYRTALAEMMKSPDLDAVLSIIPDFHSPLHPDTEVFEEVREAMEEAGKETGVRKPSAMWVYMATPEAEERFETVEGVACFGSVEQAIQGLSFCRQYHCIRRREAPVPRAFEYDRATADRLAAKGREAKCLMGRDALNLLGAFGIATVRTETVRGGKELERIAATLEFPVVAKIAGERFLHKTEWDGVITGIRTPDELSQALDELNRRVAQHDPSAKIEAYEIQQQADGLELLLGLKRDPNFGPVIACGLGGIHAEIFNDVSRELVPIGAGEAEKMLSRLKIRPLLTGYRGRPGVNRDRLVEILERLSFLAAVLDDIRELDINPLMVNARGCLAVDARILW